MIHAETPAARQQRPRVRKSIDFLPLVVDLLSVWDVLAGVTTGHLALLICCRMGLVQPLDLGASGSYWREIILGSLLACLVLREPKLAVDRKLFIPGRLAAVMRFRGAAALALLLAIGLATRAIDDMARSWLLVWSALFGACVVAVRLAFLMHVRGLIDSGALREAVAVVTMAGAAGSVASRLAADTDVLLRTGGSAGATLEHEHFAEAGGPLSAEAMIESVLSLGRSGDIDSVVVALADGNNANLAGIVEKLKCLPVQIVICPDAGWQMHNLQAVRVLGGMPMAVVANRPIRAWNLLAKLFMDKVLAMVLLILATPLMLVIAIAILLDSPGPVIFRQCRSGWSGQSFVLFKFRSMRADDCSVARQTRRNDPRCTRLGAFLRRSSLDELPQLINVLRGDMSLVGPRPHLDALHAAEIVGQAVVGEYAQRYRVKPGLTGWAQVNGFRGPTANAEQMRRRVEYDLFYIENWSLLFDVRILLMTPFAVLSAENAF